MKLIPPSDNFFDSHEVPHVCPYIFLVVVLCFLVSCSC